MARRTIDRFPRELVPPVWARVGHAQTLLGYFLPTGRAPLRPGEDGATMREVELDDGDRLAVVDAPPKGEGTLDDVCVHFFHGLTGCSESNYIAIASEALRGEGARVVAVNHRGQGAGEGLARGLYHSGSYPDLFTAVASSRERWPDALHVGVGFSLSANTLLLGAASGDARRPDAVLAVNPPVDLVRSVVRLERGVNRLYDRNFVRGMRRSLEYRQERGWLDASFEIPRGASVREADEALTAPCAGYGSANEYYAACSSGPRLAGIDVPAVILTSADDPFLSPDDLPEGAGLGDVFVHVERFGGHLGYLARGAERRWLGPAVRHYVTELSRAAG